MVRVAILGATGYTALELIKILLRHPEAEIVALTSRQEDEPHVASVHPQLTGRLDLTLQPLDVTTLLDRVDVVFSCLPHAASASSVAPFVAAGKRVIDFSADYRFDDPDMYRQWYEGEHPDPERLPQVPYGLPEFFADEIRSAALVANPGCFPTGAILGLAPLLHLDCIDPASIIVDSKSGVSGAGRTPKLATLFPECNESLAAYNVGRHRHMPEIDFILGKISSRTVQTIFTPHLVPMDRGIFTTAYATARGDIQETKLLRMAREFYAHAPFIRVLETLPATKATSHTNFCDITFRVVRGRVLALTCLDNLIKGASGAAVQNFNVMHGFPETLALL